MTTASRELGRPVKAEFVPAVSTGEFHPDGPYYATNGSSEYCKYNEAVSVWGMSYDVRLGVMNLPRLVGNSFYMAPHIGLALDVIEKHGRIEDGRRRPRLYNVSGIQFRGENRFAMPRDFYVTAVMNFIMGLDGHASYREAGVDARYMRLRANAVISACQLP